MSNSGSILNVSGDVETVLRLVSLKIESVEEDLQFYSNLDWTHRELLSSMTSILSHQHHLISLSLQHLHQLTNQLNLVTDQIDGGNTATGYNEETEIGDSNDNITNNNQEQQLGSCSESSSSTASLQRRSPNTSVDKRNEGGIAVHLNIFMSYFH